MLISCVVAAQLICASVLAYAKGRFSHEKMCFAYAENKGADQLCYLAG